MKKQRDQDVLRWIIKTTGNLRGIVLLSALQVVAALCGIGSVWLLRGVINAAVYGDEPHFRLYLAALAGITVAQIALRATARRSSESVSADAENRLKAHTYRVILTRDFAAVTAYHSGDLLNRLTSDTAVVAAGLAEIAPNMSGMLARLIGASVLLILLDAKFALLFLCGAVLLVAAARILRKKLKRLHKDVQDADGQVRSFLQETLENLLLLRTFSSEAHAGTAADEKMQAHRAARMRKLRLSNACSAGFSLAVNAGYLAGLLWCGVGILRGTITYGTLVAVLQLVGQIQGPVSGINGYLSRFYAMTASAERLVELESLPREPYAPMTDAERDDIYARMTHISMEHVTFAYPDDGEPVLRDAALSFRKGELLAIVGDSGIGKTTMLQLLLAVRTGSGTLCCTTEDGSSLPLTARTRPLFAYVPQTQLVLSGSVRDVVAGFSGSAVDEERLRWACRTACAAFVEALPQGYDSPVGERGSHLSEGQLQRLNVARALYSQAPILLLDEATSALDADTERQLLENLRTMTDRTLLLVTHHAAVVSACDRAVTLRGGQFYEE